MEIKDFIKNFTNVSKAIIEKVEGYELTGENKKERVDEVVTKYVTSVADTLELNFVFRLFLKKVIIKNIPVITQGIFDLIETKIVGITKQ